MIGSQYIYNALPYLYTTGGVGTLLVSNEFVGGISGLLLISAAMMIFHLRLEYRSKRAEEAERHLAFAQRTIVRIRNNDI